MGKISYKNPPINELVFGIQFAENISQQNIYAFYNDYLKNEFPRIQENDILPTAIEKPGLPTKLKVFAGDVITRKLFVNNANDTLIQIQSDKFFLNWRKQNEGYPNFDNVFENFKKRLANIYIINDKLKSSVNQYEITYVDHFHGESLPENLYDLNEVFTFVKLPISLKNFNFNFTIPQPDINGNLIVSVKSAIRNTDKKPLIVMQTTCRGYLPVEIENWFGKSKKILFDFFDESITETMKKNWNPEDPSALK